MLRRRLQAACAVLTLTITAVAVASPPWPLPPDSDKITGKGWLARAGDDKARFDFTAHSTNGQASGNFRYDDPGAGLQLHATTLTAYAYIDSHTRDLCGYAETNDKGRVAFHLRVTDNGKNGGKDVFILRLGRRGLVVYTTERDPKHTLGGGGIRLSPGSDAGVKPKGIQKCEI